MSNDLVKRLRICAAFDPDQAKAADRIEQLEAALREFATCDCNSNCDEKKWARLRIVGLPQSTGC